MQHYYYSGSESRADAVRRIVGGSPAPFPLFFLLLSANTYTIPRYSFFNAGGIYYSFNSDITFTKTIAGVETLTDLQSKNLLYQGQYREYPIVTAIGEEFEKTARKYPKNSFVAVPSSLERDYYKDGFEINYKDAFMYYHDFCIIIRVDFEIMDSCSS